MAAEDIIVVDARIADVDIVAPKTRRGAL